MSFKYTVFDELNLDFDPYEELKISHDIIDINDETVKDAYKLCKNGTSPEIKQKVELSYKILKTKESRARFKLLGNTPLENLDNIKVYGYKPKRLETWEWFKLIKN
ncbi:MAG: hypothetical protein JXR64_11315 [Spirochaetales bacterium]|nr:hypothetical protein [Spirochaetales bacterium]